MVGYVFLTRGGQTSAPETGSGVSFLRPAHDGAKFRERVNPRRVLVEQPADALPAEQPGGSNLPASKRGSQSQSRRDFFTFNQHIPCSSSFFWQWYSPPITTKCTTPNTGVTIEYPGLMSAITSRLKISQVDEPDPSKVLETIAIWDTGATKYAPGLVPSGAKSREIYC